MVELRLSESQLTTMVRALTLYASVIEDEVDTLVAEDHERQEVNEVEEDDDEPEPTAPQSIPLFLFLQQRNREEAA